MVFVRKQKKLSGVLAKTNPFDEFANRRRNPGVLGEKKRGANCDASAAKKRQAQDRRELFAEYQTRRKTSQFSDKRIDDNDDSHRKFLEEQKKKSGARGPLLNNKKSSLFSEIGGLTHGGRQLDDIADRELAIAPEGAESNGGSWDVDADSRKELTGSNFGQGDSLMIAPGGAQAEEKTKTREQIYTEIMDKSKAFKLREQEEQRNQEMKLSEFDAMMGELMPMLNLKASKNWERPVVDEYDKSMRLFGQETTARAAERSKTAEEIAAEKREKLLNLENQRLERAERDVGLASSKGDGGDGEEDHADESDSDDEMLTFERDAEEDAAGRAGEHASDEEDAGAAPTAGEVDESDDEDDDAGEEDDSDEDDFMHDQIVTGAEAESEFVFSEVLSEQDVVNNSEDGASTTLLPTTALDAAEILDSEDPCFLRVEDFDQVDVMQNEPGEELLPLYFHEGVPTTVGQLEKLLAVVLEADAIDAEALIKLLKRMIVSECGKDEVHSETIAEDAARQKLVPVLLEWLLRHMVAEHLELDLLYALEAFLLDICVLSASSEIQKKVYAFLSGKVEEVFEKHFSPAEEEKAAAPKALRDVDVRQILALGKLVVHLTPTTDVRHPLWTPTVMMLERLYPSLLASSSVQEFRLYERFLRNLLHEFALGDGTRENIRLLPGFVQPSRIAKSLGIDADSSTSTTGSTTPLLPDWLRFLVAEEDHEHEDKESSSSAEKPFRSLFADVELLPLRWHHRPPAQIPQLDPVFHDPRDGILERGDPKRSAERKLAREYHKERRVAGKELRRDQQFLQSVKAVEDRGRERNIEASKKRVRALMDGEADVIQQIRTSNSTAMDTSLRTKKKKLGRLAGNKTNADVGRD